MTAINSRTYTTAPSTHGFTEAKAASAGFGAETSCLTLEAIERL